MNMLKLVSGVNVCAFYKTAQQRLTLLPLGSGVWRRTKLKGVISKKQDEPPGPLHRVEYKKPIQKYTVIRAPCTKDFSVHWSTKEYHPGAEHVRGGGMGQLAKCIYTVHIHFLSLIFPIEMILEFPGYSYEFWITIFHS